MADEVEIIEESHNEVLPNDETSVSAANADGANTGADALGLEELRQVIEDGNKEIVDLLGQVPTITPDTVREVTKDTLAENNVELAKSVAEEVIRAQETDEEQAEESTYGVTLDSQQWGFVKSTMQVQSSCAILLLLVSAFAVGAICLQYLIGGANRG